MSEALRRARETVDRAERLVILTGAGVSAESGVPTFRGEAGLWKSHRPEELATPEAFAADARLVWEWYGMRRERIAGCQPNAGHHAIARACVERGGTLVTQNVDGLHQLALDAPGLGGAESHRPLELHGSIYRVRCTVCSYERIDREPIDASSVQTLPRCTDCDALLRPAVVWFGEGLDPSILERAFRAASEADVCVVAGTSAVVHPAASIPLATLRGGGRIIEVNPETTPLTRSAHVVLTGASGEILPSLLT